MGYTRRRALAGLGLAGLGTVIPQLLKKAAASSLVEPSSMDRGTCPFRLAVINDEITQDFEKACQIVSGDFGLHWIELRSMWNKNVTELDAKQIEDTRKLLHEQKLQVTDIASPLFKTDWPGAPRSSQSETRFAKPSTQTGFAASITGAWMIRGRTARQLTRRSDWPRNAVPKTTSYCCSRTRCRATLQRAQKRLKCSKRFRTRTSCLTGIPAMLQP